MPRDSIMAVGVFLTAVVVQLPFFDLWLAPMDEGHMLLYADIARTGGTFYRDATFYPLPGAFLLLKWLFDAFGPSVWISRVAVMVQFATVVTLLYLLARRMAPLRAALLGVLGLLVYRVWAFPHWHIFNYSTTALFVLLFAGVALLRFCDRGRPGWLYAAGVLFGLGVFCKQDYGAGVLVASAIVLVTFARTVPVGERPSGRQLAVGFLLPAAAVGAAAGVWFAWQGTLGDVIQFTVLNAFRGRTRAGYTTMPPLLPLFQQDPVLRVLPGITQYLPGIVLTADAASFFRTYLFRETAVVDTFVKLFFYGPYPFYLLGAVALWRRRACFRRPDERRAVLAELLLWSFGATSLLIFTWNRPQDYVHLAVLCSPIPVLAAVYGERAVAARARWLRMTAGVALLVLAVPVLGYSTVLVLNLREQRSTQIRLERAGVEVKPAEAAVIEDVVAYVREHSASDESVAVMPYFPAIHFFADRRGPHRAGYMIWPFPEIPDRDQEVVAAMEAARTNLLVYHFNYYLDFPRVPDYAPVLFDYLVDHFRIERVFGQALFGLRMAAAVRQPLRRGREVLPASLSASMVRVVDADGVVADEPADPASLVARDRWPLRRVVALRPSSGGRRTVLSVPVRPRLGEWLHTAVAVRPDAWASFRPATTSFSITVVRDGVRRLLYEHTLDPHRKLHDRGWFEIALDLSEFAGATVTLELGTETDRPEGERLEMAGFERPLLVAADTTGS